MHSKTKDSVPHFREKYCMHVLVGASSKSTYNVLKVRLALLNTTVYIILEIVKHEEINVITSV